MAATNSKMLPLGTKAPNFELMDAKENRTFTLGDVNATHGLLIVLDVIIALLYFMSFHD